MVAAVETTRRYRPKKAESTGISECTASALGSNPVAAARHRCELAHERLSHCVARVTTRGAVSSVR